MVWTSDVVSAIALAVSIENSDKGAFRNIQPLTQQVDPDQHIESAETEIADNLDPFQRIDIE